MSGRCPDLTRKPGGWFQCVLPAGHEFDSLSLHQVDVSGPFIPDDRGPRESDRRPFPVPMMSAKVEQEEQYG